LFKYCLSRASKSLRGHKTVESVGSDRLTVRLSRRSTAASAAADGFAAKVGRGQHIDRSIAAAATRDMRAAQILVDMPEHLNRHITTRSSTRSLRSSSDGPRHCCMSHSDELPSANALSALQYHVSGTLSLSPFRTVTRSRYLNLDLKHICSPPSRCFLTVLFASASEATATWRFTNLVVYCIVL